MLGGAFLRLGSTTFFFCFLLPLILFILVEKEAKDDDRSSLDTDKLVSPKKLCSWEREYKENRRKWTTTKAKTAPKILQLLLVFMINGENGFLVRKWEWWFSRVGSGLYDKGLESMPCARGSPLLTISYSRSGKKR